MKRLFIWLAIAIIPMHIQALENITLQLKWTHAFQFAGYYAAKEKGYYRDAGLDVNILAASPNTDPIMNVINNKAHYGVGTSSLLLEYAKGKPVVALAVIFQQSPYEIHATSNIGTLKDLIGKRIMIEPQSEELFAYLKKEGISLDQVTLIPHSFNPDDLINGKTDAMSGYVSNEPYHYKSLKYPFQTFAPRSAGIDFYGDNLFTSQFEVNTHSLRVKAFREASLRGWKYAKEHRDEIISLIIKKYAPHLTREALLYESDQMIPLLQPDLIEIGYMNPARWRHIANTYAILGLMPQHYAIDEFLYHEPQSVFTPWLKRTLFISAGIVAITLFVLLYVTRINRRLRESQHRFSTLFTNSPIGMVMIDYQSGKFLEANEAVLNASGYTRAEYSSLNFWDTSPYDTHDQLTAYFSGLKSDGHADAFENECLRKDGTRYPVRILCFLNHVHDRQQIWAFIEDISERKKMEESLRLTHAKYEHLVENVAGEYCFYIHDTQGIVTYISSSIINMLGYTPEEAKSHYSEFITEHLVNSQIVASTEAALRGEKQPAYLAQFRHKDGTYLWIEINESPIFNKGEVVGVEGIMHNINALKESELKLERIAHYDALTGLPNRLLLSDRLSHAIVQAQRRQKVLAVVFLDLDEFKPINDTFGHETGDELLTKLSLQMKAALREEDTLARIGGDEFVGIIADLDQIDECYAILDRLLLAASTPIRLKEGIHNVSASIGVAFYPYHGIDTDMLLRNADHAMYQAKRSGKNSYWIYVQSIDSNGETIQCQI